MMVKLATVLDVAWRLTVLWFLYLCVYWLGQIAMMVQGGGAEMPWVA